MVKNIKSEKHDSSSYTATIDDETWSGINSKTRFWDMVQEAIVAGEPVEPYVNPETLVTPIQYIQDLGRQWANLNPYKMDRMKMEMLEDHYTNLDAAGKAAFKARLTVGGVDRFSIIVNFRNTLKSIYAANPQTWNESPISKNEVDAVWNVIKSWNT